jgi:hypothetical protein
MRFSKKIVLVTCADFVQPDVRCVSSIREVKKVAAHPYQPRDLRHYTGQLTDIRPANAVDYFQRNAKADAN